MTIRRAFGAAAVIAALLATMGGAAAFDELKYPDLKGQWRFAERSNPLRIGLAFDGSKPIGPAEQAPLTRNIRRSTRPIWPDKAPGGQGIDPTLPASRPACRAS